MTEQSGQQHKYRNIGVSMTFEDSKRIQQWLKDLPTDELNSQEGKTLVQIFNSAPTSDRSEGTVVEMAKVA
jgi:hypothetical protein